MITLLIAAVAHHVLRVLRRGEEGVRLIFVGLHVQGLQLQIRQRSGRGNGLLRQEFNLGFRPGKGKGDQHQHAKQGYKAFHLIHLS